MDVRTALYRFFDAQDRLLYVGISTWGIRRWREHSRSKDWWPDVVRTTIEHYPSREAAAAAEVEAIRTEHPLYNVAHTGRERARWIIEWTDPDGTRRHWTTRRESDARLLTAVAEDLKAASPRARALAIQLLDWGLE